VRRLSRLLKIIHLVQVYPGIQAKELAEHCETTERTIYRDLEALSGADIPIVHDGHSKGYTFLGNFKMYPINWTEEEFKAFTILPSLFEKGIYKPKEFYSAYEKVMAAYHSEQAARKNYDNQFAKVIHGKNRTSLESYILQKISEAIISQRTIEALYYSFNSNSRKRRKIDPYFLIPRKNRLYIIGYCHEKEEVRTFRLNRFEDITLLNDTFIQDDINLENYLKYTWSIIKGNKWIHFKVKFSQKVARYIKENEYNVKPEMTTNPDGSLLFEVTLNDGREFLRWIMQYGPEAEIIEPQEYREKMKDKLKAWNGIY